MSRLVLTRTISERELHDTIASLRRLDDPQTEIERAVAAAMLIDSAGVRGLAERFAHARREGMSVEDVARDEAPRIPEWMSARAREMMMERLEARRHFCDAMLSEAKHLDGRDPSLRSG